MTAFRRNVERLAKSDARHGPLPYLLLLVTIVTGLVDAVSYLRLGHVFVANMTGNVVFLGFSLSEPQAFSLPASLSAMVAFLAGALAGGRIAAAAGRSRGRLFTIAVSVEALFMAVALAISVFAPDPVGSALRYALLVPLALAMGLQNAVARRLGVPDLTTTVLTMTLTGLAADSIVAGGQNPNPVRRLLAVAAMFLGAAIGALLLLQFGIASALGVALALLVISVAAANLLWSASWAVGT